MQVNRFRSPAVWILLLAVPGMAHAGVPKLESHWRTGDVTINAAAEEWDGAWTYVKQAKMDVGVLNDDEFLYLCLVTRDPGVGRQLMLQGLTVWLDPEGGEAQTLGVRYPIGLRTAINTPPEPGSLRDPEAMRQLFEASLEDLEILGPGIDDVERLEVGELQGAEIALNRIGERMVYELKIPLRRGEGRPFGIGLADGRAIGISLVSPEMERPAGREHGGFHGGFGGPGGGRGPGGGGGFGGPRDGRDGGRGERRGGDGFERPKPIDLRTTIQLAPEPSVLSEQ